MITNRELKKLMLKIAGLNIDFESIKEESDDFRDGYVDGWYSVLHKVIDLIPVK